MIVTTWLIRGNLQWKHMVVTSMWQGCGKVEKISNPRWVQAGNQVVTTLPWGCDNLLLQSCGNNLVARWKQFQIQGEYKLETRLSQPCHKVMTLWQPPFTILWQGWNNFVLTLSQPCYFCMVYIEHLHWCHKRACNCFRLAKKMAFRWQMCVAFAQTRCKEEIRS